MVCSRRGQFQVGELMDSSKAEINLNQFQQGWDNQFESIPK